MGRREKVLLLLLLLMMLLAGIFGLYLASRGLHPRQLRRRQPYRSHYQSEGDVAVLYGGPERRVGGVIWLT